MSKALRYTICSLNKTKIPIRQGPPEMMTYQMAFFFSLSRGGCCEGGEGRCLEGGRIFVKKRSRIQWSGCGCKVTFTRLPFSPFFRSLKRIRGCRKGQKSFSLFVANNVLERLCCYWIRRGARASPSALSLSAEHRQLIIFWG